MSIEGESLLLQIESVLKRAKLEGEAEVSYVFERPDIDITRSHVYGIISVLASGDLTKDSEDRIKKLLDNKDFRNKIINIKGSNSIKEDIEDSLVQILDGKTPKLPKHKAKKPDTKKVLGQARTIKGSFASLSNIMNKINIKLAEQIEQNMGKGFATSILNYRTGRFAASARVDRLTDDRKGNVTAFYTYMKYPYQTFEPGFAQGAPESRDPRLLISKSIREIAKGLITSRLKATLI